MLPPPALLAALAAGAAGGGGGATGAACDPTSFAVGVAYVVGSVVGKLNTSSAADCCAACSANGKCLCWTWADATDASNPGLCKLKDAPPGGAKDKPTKVSGRGNGAPPAPPAPSPPGPAPPSPSNATCDPSRFEQHTAFKVNHVVAQGNTSDAAGCCAMCAAAPVCQCWTWQPSGLCKLKDAPPGDRTSSNGKVSGLGHVPPVTPAPPPPPPFVPVPPPKGKPNILFVLTDDQDALLNGYDPAVGVAHMTALNTRVRSAGTMFTNYFLAYPLCSPSRSSILTGRYPHNTGFTGNARLNASSFHPVQERDTVNVWLNRTGYHTMLCGKYMNGYHTGGNKLDFATYVPPGWGDWYGFQTVAFFGTRVNVNGESVLYPKDAYQTDIIANLTLDWLRTRWERERPFFMFVTPHAPHAPYTPAPRHAGTLKGISMPADPAFNEKDALQSTLPGKMAGLKTVKKADMDDIYEKRAESLLAVDEMIGGLLDEVAAQKVDAKTYFFFSADNGYHLGQHRLSPGKREFFQHDIAVPLIVSGPGVARGATVAQLAGNYDLAATWAELAGVEPTPGAATVDGVSLAALLRGAGAAAWARTATLQEGWSTQAGDGGYTALRVVDGATDALYVESGQPGEPDGAWRAYFDCAADPWQTRNVYSALDNATAATLAARLAAVRGCVGDKCPGH